MLAAKGFVLGVWDGWRQPFDLSSGRTWINLPDGIENPNYWYDRGANLGQSAGLFARNIFTLGRYQP